MNACAKCGACSVVCPVYRVTGQEAHTARGKLHLALSCELPATGPVFEEIFSRCLLCGACAAVCPRGIDICGVVVRARAAFPAVSGPHGYAKFLARKALGHPETLASLRVLGRAGAQLFLRHLPEDSGLRLRLALFREDEKTRRPRQELAAVSSIPGQKEGLICFPGCTAHFLFPEILASCTGLAAGAGYLLSVPEGLSCCGLAAFSAGDEREARRCARVNIAVLEQLGSGPILVPCASCYVHLYRYRELFAEDPGWRIRAEAIRARLVELCSWLDGWLAPASREEGRRADAEKKIRVFYHDPCHFRHGPEECRIIAQPRRILAARPSLALLELPDGPQCCGQGGLFHISAPEISAMICDALAFKVLALAPDVVTTTCSGCLMQWRVAVEAAGVAGRVRVVHLAELLAMPTEAG